MAVSRRVLPAEETAVFCDQVAMVIKSGVPLHDGVETLCEGQRDTQYGESYERLSRMLTETGSLYEAVTGAGIFPEYMAGMVKTGELSGRLDSVMEKLAGHYRREARINASVRSAVIYPVVLIGILAIVVAILTVSVLPVFSRVYASLGTDIDAAAAAMNTGVTIGRVLTIIVSVLLVTGLVMYALMKTKARDSVMETLTAVAPPLRKAADLMSAERFASVSAMVLASGMDVSVALDTVDKVVEDRRSLRRFERIKSAVEGGATFSGAVAAGKVFEPLHSKMITVGAMSGRLDSVMESLAVTYEEKADDAIQHAVSLIEPTLIAVLCAAVGGIMLCVMLPLINILSTIG